MALVAQFFPGPSLTTGGERHIEVANADLKFTRQLAVGEATGNVTFPVKAGVNRITITCSDQPNVTVLPNGDTRALLLRIGEPRLMFQPQQ
jgi:hypothetical protein